MKREEVILICKKCGASHLITPPKRKLKKTDNIELDCYRCNFKNNYRYIYNKKDKSIRMVRK
jgi:RNase P subunit RPR2